VARTGDEVAEVATALRAKGATALALTADLADPVAIAEVTARATAELGAIDILVNNAAVIGPLGRFPLIDIEEWAYANEINVLAPVRLSHALLPSMLQSGWGRIINVSTGAVNFPRRDDAYNAYIATKMGLEGHSLNLAAELEGSGVTLNIVRPGIVDTAMQTLIRAQDPNVIGESFHQRFQQRYEEGALLAPDVPARLIIEALLSERNGEILAPAPPPAL
jgi:NAD(P)-dependent dehydrogenase (short-subunit alcohol dehydrogenase family)